MAFIEHARYKYGPFSSSALLLEFDARIAFRAGAWISVIVLAAAAVEAQYRHVFAEDYETKANDLYGSDADLRWLRELRNEIMHVSPPGTKSQLWLTPGGDIGASHSALESLARRAVIVMFRSVYAPSAP